MIQNDREAILEEEIIILRNSGEIPEIALHSTLYYLEEDAEGPQIKLLEDELQTLYDASLARAREIVLRDLDPANRDLSLYRGLARSIINWHRLQNFCSRINRQCPGFDEKVARAFTSFLEQELEDVQQSLRDSSVNCSEEEIRSFCSDLCIDTSFLPSGWKCLCRE